MRRLCLLLAILCLGWTAVAAAPSSSDLAVTRLQVTRLDGQRMSHGAKVQRGEKFRIRLTVTNRGRARSIPCQVYYALCNQAHQVQKQLQPLQALSPGQTTTREFLTSIDSDAGTWMLEGNVDLRDHDHVNNHLGLFALNVEGAPNPRPEPRETPTGSVLPTQRRLYAPDNVSGRIFIYDIGEQHKLIQIVDLKDVGFIEGLAAHAPSRRLFVTDSGREEVTAYDLLTNQPAWVKKIPTPKGHKFWHLDRMTCSVDGRHLYVPCRGADQVLVLDATNGEVVKTLRVSGNPHNTFTGEKGRYVYCEARSSRDLTVIDPRTQTIVATIKGFSSPLRPFCVTPDERFALVQMERTLGFAVADLRGDDPKRFRKLMEVVHPRPAQLPPDSCSPHKGHPEGHGIAIRPHSTEVWFLDDHYGFLNIYDYSPLPSAPCFLGSVKLFQDYHHPWTDTTFRWLTFSADGRYCYAPNGWVIDCAARKDTGMRWIGGEKALEIDFKDGVPVRNGGQNGGVYR